MVVYFAGDLSCTTVNAVNRLPVDLETSRRLSGEVALLACQVGQPKETQLSRLPNLCHSAPYPNTIGESWSPRSVDTPVNTDKTTTSAQIPGPRGTFPEPSGLRNPGTAGDRILQVSVCTSELTLCHSSPYLNNSWGKLVSQEC
uniref:Uncharacterized protein n=1 Tax=Mus musculus TaxID=10090 RepID=Q3UX00_MOUSE|nr:unnamed protein product [Mus musculus]